MSQQHDDTAPVEHDPTGMRALLASLPDPGPMPDDLVARISAALADEASRGTDLDRMWRLHDADGDSAAAAEGGGAGEAGAVHDGPVADVVPIRRRWFRPRHLAVAAAVVGVLGLGGFLVRSVPGDLMASFGLSSGSADSSGSAVAAAAGREQALVAPEAGTGDVVVVMSGLEYTSDRLDVTARQLDDGSVDPITDLSAESPALGPIATPIGARACATALGIPTDAGILVDLADVDGASAAVLVVHTDTGRTAWAVDRSCTTGNTGLIRGPVPLP